MKGKVVLVSFPFDDLSGSKVRPAVCLTDPIGPYDHVILAFITSRIKDETLPTDIIIDLEMDNFSTTGLRVSSILQLHRLLTASRSIIRRELGSVTPNLQVKIDDGLRQLFLLT